MKLLLSADEYCGHFDGNYYLNETGLTHLKRYLVVFDHVVVVFRTFKAHSTNELGKYNIKIDDARVSFVEVPFFQGPREFITKFLSIKKTIASNIKDCDFAILRLPSTTAFVTYFEVSKLGIPYATEIVFDCFDAVTSSNSLLERIIWRSLHKIQVKACSNAMGVSCVTEHYLQRRYYSKRPGAISSFYSSIELTPDFFYSSRSFPNKDIIRIVHVANQVQFDSRKGHNELIEVVSKLNSLKKRVDLVFIGEDYCNGISKLKNWAKSLSVLESVHFSGYLNRSQMRDVMINADIAILPTKAEGLPRVVIEAMALGLPCITSPVSGNPELIDQQFLVNYNDIDGMVNACESLISRPDIYEGQSRINFERSLQYSSLVLDPRRTRFYKDLIAHIK